MSDYQITLFSGRGLEYRDRYGVYLWDVRHALGEWRILVPGSVHQPGASPPYPERDLTAAEEARIVPRLVEHLGKRGWRALFGGRDRVVFVSEAGER